MLPTVSSTTEDHLSLLKTGISKSIWHLSALMVQWEWQEHGCTPISGCSTSPQGQGSGVRLPPPAHSWSTPSPTAATGAGRGWNSSWSPRSGQASSHAGVCFFAMWQQPLFSRGCSLVLPSCPSSICIVFPDEPWTSEQRTVKTEQCFKLNKLKALQPFAKSCWYSFKLEGQDYDSWVH